MKSKRESFKIDLKLIFKMGSNETNIKLTYHCSSTLVMRYWLNSRTKVNNMSCTHELSAQNDNEMNRYGD